MNQMRILSKRQKFEAQGSGRFAKDVLHVGKWIHPLTGREVFFDEARLEKLAEYSTRYREAGNKIPYPDGHSTKAMDNLGEWQSPFITYGKNLIAVVEPKDKVALQKMRDGAIDAVSVCIDFDVMDSKGNRYPEVITHICATDYPVITEQKEFVELSTEQRGADLYVPEELAAQMKKQPTGSEPGPHSRRIEMDLKKLAEVLGLAQDTAPETIAAKAIEKLGAVDGEKKAAVSALETQLAASLAEHGLMLAAGKVAKAESKPQTPLEKSQAEELASLQLDNAKAKIAQAQALAATLVKEGKIPTAMQDRLSKVLATAGKIEALSLGTSPGQVMRTVLDLNAELGAIFGSVSSLTKERLSQLTPEQLSTQKKDQEALDARSKEIAARVQPAAAAK